MEKEKLHIIPHDHAIDRSDRERLLAQKAQLIWFVGLSGSGKSTLASRVEQELHQMGRLTYILDGDNVRSGLNKDLDFSEASRMENIRRIGEVSKLMVDAGLVVITAFISPFRSDRETIRELVGADRFVEVHVDCPIEECEKRDVKGLYAKARQGLISNFTGISSPFEAPEQPEVRVQTHLNDIDECTNTIINYLKNQDA
ncbi:MAG: Adenylyl-sulfate kinase [Flavobacteriia bacterium]|jgi:adenylylsulfate kinase|nr:MAG: Adenylyl-sulfate kinase [Flavobacteriia bacterium]